jgi:predicted PurR-regulated permease PerM
VYSHIFLRGIIAPSSIRYEPRPVVDKRRNVIDSRIASQRKAGALAAEPNTQKKLGTVLFYGIAILLGYLAYLVAAPFLVPLAWAAVLAVVTYPVHDRLRMRMGRNFAALTSTTAVTLVLIVPAIFVLIAFVQQAVAAVQGIRFGMAAGRYAWAQPLWMHLQSRFPNLIPADFGGAIQQYAQKAAAYLAGRLGSVLKNTAEFILDLSYTILAMFYFFRDGVGIVDRLRKALPFEPSEQNLIVSNTRELIFATVISSLVAAAIHGVIGGVAFALTGIQAPLFWGVLMGFFSLIPLIGSALVWVPLSISLILGGHLWSGIILAGVCSLVVGMVDNFVRPMLISGRAEMSSLLIFVGVLGGIHVFGLLGVVVGPIVLATAATLLDFYAPLRRAGNRAAKPGGRDASAVLE